MASTGSFCRLPRVFSSLHGRMRRVSSFFAPPVDKSESRLSRFLFPNVTSKSKFDINKLLGPHQRVPWQYEWTPCNFWNRQHQRVPWQYEWTPCNFWNRPHHVYVMFQLRLVWEKTWIWQNRKSSWIWQNRKSSQLFCSLFVDVCIVYVMFQLRLDWEKTWIWHWIDMIFRLGYNKYDFLLFIIYYLFLLFILLFSLIGQNRKSSQSELPLGGVLLVPTHVRTATWLILPVVICLSQRLSHACLSTSLTKVKPRMAH